MTDQIDPGLPTGSRFGEEPLSESQIRDRATRGAAGVMLRGLLVRAIGLLGNVVLARLLTPHDFGVIAFGMSIAAVGEFIASGGLTASLISRAGGISLGDLRLMFGFQLLLVTLFTAAVAAVAIPLGETGLLAAVMVSSLIIDTARAPNGILLERSLQYRLIVRAEVAETIAWNVWAVAAVLAGMGVWGVATAQVFRALVGAGFMITSGPAGLIRPLVSWRRTRGMLSLGVKFQAISFVLLARDQGLNVVIAAVGGLTVLGLWSIVYRLATVVGVLLESLWRVSFPAVSRMLEARYDAGPALERGLTLAAALTGLIVAPLVGSAPALVPFLFGSRWTGAVAAMPATGLSLMLAGPVMAVGIGYMMSSGKSTRMLAVSIADFAVLWTVDIALLPLLHVVGLSLGALVASIVVVTMLGMTLRREANVSVARSMFLPVVAATISGVPAWWLSRSWGANVFSVAASAAVAGTGYVVLLLLVRRALVIDTVAVAVRAVRRSPAAA